jgi:hypothetical protein
MKRLITLVAACTMVSGCAASLSNTKSAPTYGHKTTGSTYTSDNHNELYDSVAAIYAILGIPVCDGSDCIAATYADIVSLFDSGSCSGYLKSDGTCDEGGGGSFIGDYTDIVELFGSGSCSGYLRSDGTCDSDLSVWDIQSSEPSHTAGRIWTADSDNWNPCNSSDTDDYLVYDTGSTFQPLWKVDDDYAPIIQTAVVAHPVEGWHYWFANTSDGGADDPNDEDGITGAYRCLYVDSDYVTDQTEDGGIVLGYVDAPTPTIDDPDNWTSTSSIVGWGDYTANDDGDADVVAVGVGMNFGLDVEGDYIVTVTPDASDTIYLNGSSCGVSKGITSNGSSGAAISMRYRSPGTWKVKGYAWSCIP